MKGETKVLKNAKQLNSNINLNTHKKNPREINTKLTFQAHFLHDANHVTAGEGAGIKVT